MKTEETKHNALRQAIDRMDEVGLSSNFNYRMMNKIREEAVHRRKRQRIISWSWLIAACLLLSGFGLYMCYSYIDISLAEYILVIKEKANQSEDLVFFYGYIAILVLILLGLDYGMRRHRRKVMNE